MGTRRSQAPGVAWRRTLAAATLGVLGAATGVFGSWDGTADIALGDKAASSFAGSAAFDEAHAYRFFAPANTKVSAALKLERGTTLVPAMRIVGEGGRTLSLPATTRLAATTLPASGTYVLEVARTAGTGSYALTTKAILPTRLSFRTDDGSVAFGAVAGTKLTAKLKATRGGNAAGAVFATLEGPDGAVTIPANATSLARIDLPAAGVYTLSWDQTVAGPVDVSIGLKGVAGKTAHDNAAGQTQLPMSRIEPGDPTGAPSAGYLGSDACRTCHASHYERMAGTAHNAKLRNPMRAGLAGYAVAPEVEALFKAAGGTDLTTLPVFTGYQGLKLSYVAGDALPYKVTVGTTTYDVMYVMGGNGIWKQRYVVEIGRSHYTAPIQWNEAEKTWSAYNIGDWFDAATKAPKNVAKNKSWELKCGACHATGVNLSYDAASGEYLTGYAQLNVGCEACHGPGAEHVADATEKRGTTPDLSKIVNPRRFLQVRTPVATKLASLACGQCHHRGTGGKAAGAPDKPEYPWKDGVGLYRLGYDDFEQFYTTAGATSFQRYKDNPMGAATPTDPSDDTWLASKQHHQQYLDEQMGPHAPDKIGDAVCFDCHDPHGNGAPHQIRTRTDRAGDVYTGVSARTNALCLTCHIGTGDFANVTRSDVQDLADTASPAPARVVSAVVDHMKDKAGMPIAAAAYDPAGSEVGNCVRCHMPYSSTSATVTKKDKAGNSTGDVHGHTFVPIWPNASRLLNGGMSNSCETCHPTSPTDAVGPILAEWATNPDAAAEGSSPTFHADVPRNYQNAVANHGRDGGVACAACHTTEGFLRIQVNGSLHDLTEDGDQAARDAIVKYALQHDAGITCQACHGRQPDGTFAAGANPLRFPKDELCQKCHNNETVLFEDWVADGEILRHPADQMLRGVDGAQVPGQTYASSTHVTTFDTCVECHMSTASGGGHGFDPKLASCTPCHAAATTFDIKNAQTGDWDGDGTIEGVQSEVTGCVDALRGAILAETPSVAGTTVTWDGSRYFLIGNAVTPAGSSNTTLLDAAADAPILRAIFNVYYVNHDKSKGVHNPRYAVQLLQKSYKELTGTEMSATLR